MKVLIDVFRMSEISKEQRVKILIKLGHALNYQFGNNVTEPLVYELVKILDPTNKEVDEHHKKFL